MNGALLKRARERRGWSQAQLASKVGVGYKTVGNWENGNTVPQNRLGMLRDLFGTELDEGDETETDPIRSASDVELLAELLRRASARQRSTA